MLRKIIFKIELIIMVMLDNNENGKENRKTYLTRVLEVLSEHQKHLCHGIYY
jgi:hypothetical protein